MTEEKNNEPLLVVIESPLGSDTPEGFARNKRYALWCAYHCFTRGEAAYASHLFYPQFLDDRHPEQREFGIQAGYQWALQASKILFYMDLGESPGMARARKRWTEIYKVAEDRLPKCVLAEFEAVEDRRLPKYMFAEFEAGLLPTRTPGFGI